jgi:hypothetical protein
MLIYRCPATNEVARTSIDTTEETLRRLKSVQISVWCEHCKISHSIPASAASIGMGAAVPIKRADYTPTPS